MAKNGNMLRKNERVYLWRNGLAKVTKAPFASNKVGIHGGLCWECRDLIWPHVASKKDRKERLAKYSSYAFDSEFESLASEPPSMAEVMHAYMIASL